MTSLIEIIYILTFFLFCKHLPLHFNQHAFMLKSVDHAATFLLFSCCRIEFS